MKTQIEPRGLPLSAAAMYVGLSSSTFLAEVKKGLAPNPTWLTGNRKVWLREKLDEYLDRKDQQLESSATWSERTEKLRASLTSGSQKQKEKSTHGIGATVRQLR